MRIISGVFKGRLIHSLNDRSVRPVTDRVKTTIFNMLQNRLNLKGAKVLDLFAGTGSLGFETISRGAEFVIFVDNSNDMIEIIKRNANSLGCMDKCSIIRDDAIDFLRRVEDKFDLIFADPPYVYNMTENIPSIVFEKNILNKNGYLIIEHSKKQNFKQNYLYNISELKEFGATHVSFFIHGQKEEK